MAGETYYFSFSVIAAIGALFWLANLIYLRLRNKSFYGQEYKPGTKEHEGISKLASNRNIFISAIVSLAFIINLIYDINRLMNLADQDYVRGLFVYVSIFIFTLCVISFFHIRKQTNISKSGKK